MWIDVLTPKQALFFTPLRKLLMSRGSAVLVTTRKYREAVQTLSLKRVPHLVVGEHGGGTTYGKLVASGARVVKLAGIVHEWKPDVAVSFSSPEAARVAFGLAIPHVAVNDSPHSWMVARLTVPLSRFVCFPWIIQRAIWKAFGAPARALMAYKALDPAAWLKGFRPNPRVLSELGLDKGKPLVLLRTEEAFAAYLMGSASDKRPVVGPIIDQLLRSGLDLQIVVSTRYGLQAPVLRKMFGRRVVVVDRIIDATSLLNYASVFIGTGGTMTVEAALMGTLAISSFPGPKPIYISYLERKGLVETIHSPRVISSKVVDILTSPQDYEPRRKSGRELLNWMEDPSPEILRKVGEAAR